MKMEILMKDSSKMERAMDRGSTHTKMGEYMRVNSMMARFKVKENSLGLMDRVI